MKDKQFQGGCGPQNLVEMLQTFVFWSQDCYVNKSFVQIKEESTFFWLQNWYQSQCNGNWEHEYGITIETTDQPGWHIKINLSETEVEDVPFETIMKNESKLEWYYCFLKEKKFEALCGPIALNKVLEVFRLWIEQFQK